jgi:hypothetical protein
VGRRAICARWEDARAHAGTAGAAAGRGGAGALGGALAMRSGAVCRAARPRRPHNECVNGHQPRLCHWAGDPESRVVTASLCVTARHTFLQRHCAPRWVSAVGRGRRARIACARCLRAGAPPSWTSSIPPHHNHCAPTTVSMASPRGEGARRAATTPGAALPPLAPPAAAAGGEGGGG